MSDEVRVADVPGKKVQSERRRCVKSRSTPVFLKKHAIHSGGVIYRLHRNVTSSVTTVFVISTASDESRPGVTTRVSNPDESMDMVKKVVDKYDYIKVVGIAGPGEPLANEETFETLRRLHERSPMS